MRLEFLIEKEGKIINTYDGSEIDLNNEFVVKRFERKNEIFFLKRIIENNLLHSSTELFQLLIKLLICWM